MRDGGRRGRKRGSGWRTLPLADLWARRPQSAAPASTTSASPKGRPEEGSAVQPRVGGFPRRRPRRRLILKRGLVVGSALAAGNRLSTGENKKPQPEMFLERKHLILKGLRLQD